VAFERPTLDQIQQRCYADFRAELPGDEPTLPLTTEYAFVAAQSGLSHMKHGRIDYAMRQQFPDTADSEGLDHWASVWGVQRQQPQIANQGSGILVSGTPLTPIPIGTAVVSPTDNLTYTTSAAAALDTFGQAIIPVAADQPGSAYNKAPKTEMQLPSPPAGVNSFAIVAGVTVGITGGTDLESDDLLRQRVLERIQQGPIVGRPGDWARLALEVPGTTRSWEQPAFLGPGSIGVFFVLDNDPISAVPNATQVANMQAYLDAEAPLAYTNVALAPADAPLAVSVTIDPDTTDIRNAVEEEIADMLLREATPLGFTLTTVVIDQALARAVGEGTFTRTAPLSDLLYTLGNMPITFTVSF